MHKRIIAAAAVATLAVCSLTAGAVACTRFIYETGDGQLTSSAARWIGRKIQAPISGHSQKVSNETAPGPRVSRVDIEARLGDLVVL